MILRKVFDCLKDGMFCLEEINMREKIVNIKISSPNSPSYYVFESWQKELIKQKNHIVVLHAQDGYGKTSYMAYYSEKISMLSLIHI